MGTGHKASDILPQIKEIFKIRHTDSEAPYVHLAEVVCSSPPWFQDILLNDDVEIHTTASYVRSAWAFHRSRGERGNITLSFTPESGLGPGNINFTHYRHSPTLFHELGHRFADLLNFNDYYDGKEEDASRWRNAVETFMAKRRVKNPLYRHAAFNYKKDKYLKEVFAEIVSEYLMLYQKHGENADVMMRQLQPELWPVFSECILPKLEALARDMALPLGHYIEHGNWSIRDIPEFNQGLHYHSNLALEIPGMTGKKARLLYRKLDAVDGGATANHRMFSDGIAYFRQAEAGVLEKMLVDAGKQLNHIPHPGEQVRQEFERQWGVRIAVTETAVDPEQKDGSSGQARG